MIITNIFRNCSIVQLIVQLLINVSLKKKWKNKEIIFLWWFLLNNNIKNIKDNINKYNIYIKD